MIKQLGSPDLLLTLSVADNKLPAMKSFYESLGIDVKNKSTFKLNLENPHYQTVFNLKILESFLKEFIQNIFCINDMFTTFEFQRRGTLHTHSLIWLDDKMVILINCINYTQPFRKGTNCSHN